MEFPWDFHGFFGAQDSNFWGDFDRGLGDTDHGLRMMVCLSDPVGLNRRQIIQLFWPWKIVEEQQRQIQIRIT